MGDAPLLDADDPRDRRILAALQSLDEADLVAPPSPPPEVWAGIAGAAGANVPAEPAAGQRRSHRLAIALLAAAATVAVVAVSAALVRSPDPTVEERSLLTDAGLPNPSGLEGRAELIDDGGTLILDLQLDGLPATDAAVYEVWLLASDGSGLQSLGLTTGSGRFVVPEGIDVATFDVVDVSREPVDGDPGHSGDSLVRGTLERA